MAEPTIQDIFGAGATQTATTITILKSDLPMTAAAANKGEQIFAAIAKKAATYLTTSAFGNNSDQSINISAGFDSLVYRTIGNDTLTFLQSQLTVNFAKLQSSSGITPDSY